MNAQAHNDQEGGAVAQAFDRLFAFGAASAFSLFGQTSFGQSALSTHTYY